MTRFEIELIYEKFCWIHIYNFAKMADVTSWLAARDWSGEAAGISGVAFMQMNLVNLGFCLNEISFRQKKFRIQL